MATISDGLSGIDLGRIKIRRHNGQCAYGEWLPADSESVPPRVADAAAEDIAETDEDEGQIEVGGQIWVYRRA